MPTPAGLSGAPLFEVDSLDIVGMVYGSADVGTIDQFRSEDPETGKISPEVVRVVSFGLAHQASLLAAASGPATGGKRLIEVLRR